jgi:hypothetical protein
MAMMVVLGFAATGLFTPRSEACPFCNAVSQTLRQEMEAMDAVVIGESIQNDALRDKASGDVRMRVLHVLKGGDDRKGGVLVKAGDEVTAVYYGEVAEGRKFMLSGVDPPELLWSCLPLTEKAEVYLKKIPSLSKDPVERLKFYYPYLQDDDPMLSRDSYDEFAITPYDEIKKLKPELNHDELVQWLEDPELPTDRKRLYLTLLGVVGDKSDLPRLEQMLRSTQKSTQGGLDATIGCYLTLAGEEGLPLINELFMSNPKAPYADTYAAIMAIRFHGTEGDVIARSALTESLHPVLDRPDLADLVIPDLARWKDWSLIDRMVKLFTESDPENNWVRVPVVNYLRACPLPEAEAALEKLKEIDPESVRRANTFFSIPVPARDVQPEESSFRPQRPQSDVQPPLPRYFEPVASNSTRPTVQIPVAAIDALPANPQPLLTVMGMAIATLAISFFLLLSGGGTSRGQVIAVGDNATQSPG